MIIHTVLQHVLAGGGGWQGCFPNCHPTGGGGGAPVNYSTSSFKGSGSAALGFAVLGVLALIIINVRERSGGKK